jgi:hypothetical protein
MTEFVDFKMSDGDWAYRLEFTSKVDYTLSIIRPHLVQQIHPLHSKQLCAFDEEGAPQRSYAKLVNRDCVFAVDESRFTCSHDFKMATIDEKKDKVAKDMEMAAEDKAAITIQCFWGRYKTRMFLRSYINDFYGARLCSSEEEEEDRGDEPIGCVGCGKDGIYPENQDGDTMCPACHSDDDVENTRRAL